MNDERITMNDKGGLRTATCGLRLLDNDDVIRMYERGSYFHENICNRCEWPVGS